MNQGGLLTRCERIARGLVIISFSWPFMVVLFIRRTGSSLWMDLGLTRWILGGHETSTRCPTAEAQCPITATVPQQCHASAMPVPPVPRPPSLYTTCAGKLSATVLQLANIFLLLQISHQIKNRLGGFKLTRRLSGVGVLMPAIKFTFGGLLRKYEHKPFWET